MVHKTEFDHQRTDYILGLLSPNDQQAFEQHLKKCQDCQREVAIDRQVIMVTRQTLQTVPAIPMSRLQALQPPLPRRMAVRGWGHSLFARVAQPVMAGVTMFSIALGSFGAIGSSVPAVAATSTSTLTATMTQAPTAVVVTTQEQDGFVEASATPAPPTPIAQLNLEVPLETQPSPYQND